jgi:hypothetical protein
MKTRINMSVPCKRAVPSASWECSQAPRWRLDQLYLISRNVRWWLWRFVLLFWNWNVYCSQANISLSYLKARASSLFTSRLCKMRRDVICVSSLSCGRGFHRVFETNFFFSFLFPFLCDLNNSPIWPLFVRFNSLTVPAEHYYHFPSLTANCTEDSLNLNHSLKVRKQVLNPVKATYEIIVFYVLDFYYFLKQAEI